MLHARIAERAFNTPLLVEPSKAMAFLSGLGPRILGRRVELADGATAPDGAAALPARASLLAGGLADSYRQHGDAPYPVVDGIAVIEIAGVLIHRGGWIGQSSGQTSYEGIAAQIEAAASDPAVRGLALEIDSFGGEVAGVFDLADRIRAIRGSKPIWAFVAEHAFSAGYALASQADRILLPRTGALGSIGVVVLHAGRVPVQRAMRKLTDLAEAGRRQDPRYAHQLERLLELRDRRAPKVLDRLRVSLHELLPTFESLGLVLALENLPSWDAVPTEAEIVDLCEEFPVGTLRYWHDLGHGQVRENLGFIHHEAVAHRMAGLMAGMHVHDVQFPTRDHLMPPHGAIRFERFRELAARKIPLVLEPAPGTPPEAVREAVDFLRSIWA